MTNHLTEHELVEAADGALSEIRQRHVETCAGCAGAVEALGSVLADVQLAGEVPEPSPLFWDHFSRRVREATDGQPIASSPGFSTAWWRPAVVGVAMMTGVVVGAQWFAASRQTMPVETVAVSGVSGAVDEDAEPADARPRDLEWEAVAALASGLDTAAVEAMAPLPVAATPLVEDLNGRELEEFARLLRVEMGGVQ